jgi:hypothetical protein
MVTLEKHIDGEWWTSNHEYKTRKLQIKMRKSWGAKIHIWNVEGTKVLKTFRYTYYDQNFLLKKAQSWIDKGN